MIHRQYGEITFECDACDTTLDTGAEDWPAAQAALRLDNWKVEKVGDEWTHLCPDCRRRAK